MFSLIETDTIKINGFSANKKLKNKVKTFGVKT